MGPQTVAAQSDSSITKPLVSGKLNSRLEVRCRQCFIRADIRQLQGRGENLTGQHGSPRAGPWASDTGELFPKAPASSKKSRNCDGDAPTVSQSSVQVEEKSSHGHNA